MDAKWFEQKFGRVTAQFFARREEIMRSFPPFQCPPSCRRPCCTRVDATHANVSFFDIILMAALRNEHPASFFQKFIELGVLLLQREDAKDFDPHLWKIQWRLRRSCPLLTPEGSCSVHVGKPLSCRVFPDMDLVTIANKRPASLHLHLIQDAAYECFHPNISDAYTASTALSRYRTAADLVVREMELAELIFFQRTPFVVDVTPNLEQIREALGLLSSSTTQIGISDLEATVLKMVREKVELRYRRFAVQILDTCQDPTVLERWIALCRAWESVINQAQSRGDRECVLMVGKDLSLERAPLRRRTP